MGWVQGPQRHSRSVEVVIVVVVVVVRSTPAHEYAGDRLAVAGVDRAPPSAVVAEKSVVLVAVVALVSTPGTLEFDAANPATGAGLLKSTTFYFA